jgi:hypothetical protein
MYFSFIFATNISPLAFYVYKPFNVIAKYNGLTGLFNCRRKSEVCDIGSI